MCISCEEARKKIRKACGDDSLAVHFLVGGTQTNTTVISAALRPYQGAVAAVSGHINVHETGAIEATGHKVLPLPSGDGKISAVQVDEMCHAHFTDGSQEHMVQPGMVYISHPTEYGTLYTKKELAAFFSASTNIGESFERFVLDNYRKADSVKELADLYHISERSFNRKFHSCFGESPYQWIQKKKARHIQEMINNPELSFKEIAGYFGFSTSSHFTAYCQRMFGMSPSELRKKNRDKWIKK